MKKIIIALSLLVLCCAALRASDSRWVKASFRWTGTGLIQTEVFPLFSNDYRIRYSSPQHGGLAITLIDAALKNPLPDREIVSTKHLAQPGYRECSGRTQACLRIQGDGSQWVVELDQYLDSVEEWRLRSYLKQNTDTPPSKIAAWAGDASQEISYAPKRSPWKLQGTQRGDGKVQIVVRNAARQVLMQIWLTENAQTDGGWMLTNDAVTISVYSEQASWELGALAK